MLRSFLVLLSLTAIAAAQTPEPKTPRAAKPPPPTAESIEKSLARKPVEAHLDQPYAGTANPKQMVDLYLPKQRKSDKPLPVIVFIHGGGWMNGDRKASSTSMIKAAETGNYAGVAVGYRLSGEAKWPAQIHDCKAAIRWIRGHAKEYNLDPDHIGVWGTSAGGHLVSLLGTSADVKELNGDLGEFKDLSSRVTCVANMCGPQDLTAPLMQGKAAEKDDPALAALFGSPLKDHVAEAKAASPLTYVSATSAPFFTAQGTDDQRVNFTNSKLIDAALRKAGVPSVLYSVEGGGHSFHNSDVDKDVYRFFDMYLRGQKDELTSRTVPQEPKTSSAKAK